MNENSSFYNLTIIKNFLTLYSKSNTYNSSGSIISNGCHSSSGYESTITTIKIPFFSPNSKINESDNKNETNNKKVNSYYLPY